MRSVKNFLRLALWWFAFPVLSRIQSLENAFIGSDCYIFGDGSSIKNFDLSVFGDKVGIAVNAFPRHKDAHLTDVRFWIVAEAGFFLPPVLRTRQNPISTYANRVRFQSFFKH